MADLKPAGWIALVRLPWDLVMGGTAMTTQDMELELQKSVEWTRMKSVVDLLDGGRFQPRHR